MKTFALTAALAAIVAVGSIAPSVAYAANARHPYSHVNHANDAGNRKGDAETDRLNAQQLSQHANGQ